MSQRLQVIMDEAELREIRKAARAEGVTVAEWVRRSLRAARRAVPTGDPKRKLAIVRAAAQYSFPTGDIAQMLGEIERGYGSGLPE